MSDTQTILYVLLAVAAIYIIYVTFFEKDSFENSTVRSDAGGDKPFEKLSIKEQIQYLTEKQDELVRSSSVSA